jgi:cyclopropane-fatty-acyl-phospholipid synthase
MNSQVCTGSVTHVRLGPVQHRFGYPACFCVLDLAELPQLGRLYPVFGYNRAGLLAIHDRDYLGAGPGGIGDKLHTLLAVRGLDSGLARAELVTVPRFWHYAYNPVNFYWCYRADGTPACGVAEVHNTYGETHHYVLDEPVLDCRNSWTAFRARKEFFVSPFFDLRGEYVFRFRRAEEEVGVQVELWRDGRLALWARLRGRSAPLTHGNALRAVVRHPLTAALALPRIVRQGLRLRGKGLKPLMKTAPASPRRLNGGTAHDSGPRP